MGKNPITESELFAAYQRAKVKAATSEFEFYRLSSYVEEIEAEEFENHATYLVNFQPWQKMKTILGLLVEISG
jgi:hypothetical protein